MGATIGVPIANDGDTLFVRSVRDVKLVRSGVILIDNVHYVNGGFANAPAASWGALERGSMVLSMLLIVSFTVYPISKNETYKTNDNVSYNNKFICTNIYDLSFGSSFIC